MNKPNPCPLCGTDDIASVDLSQHAQASLCLLHNMALNHITTAHAMLTALANKTQSANRVVDQHLRGAGGDLAVAACQEALALLARNAAHIVSSAPHPDAN